MFFLFLWSIISRDTITTIPQITVGLQRRHDDGSFAAHRRTLFDVHVSERVYADVYGCEVSTEPHEPLTLVPMTIDNFWIRS
jgi:hypothetical protein